MDWLTDQWNTFWNWMSVGGVAWVWMTALVAAAWLSRWLGEENVQEWTAIAFASTGAFCILFYLNNLMGGSGPTVEGVAVSDRWLLTTGLFCWLYVVQAGYGLKKAGSAGGGHAAH